LQAELAALGGNDGMGIKKPARGGGGDVVSNGLKAAGPRVGNGKTRSKPPVKFKDDKGNSWTGRGATPRWLAAYEAEGKTRDQFAV